MHKIMGPNPHYDKINVRKKDNYMKDKISATTHFTNQFQGRLELKEGSVEIGGQPHQLTPYNMLQGALMACFHATFIEILAKKRQSFESVTYKTSGEKRDTVPTTIEHLHIDIMIQGASQELAVEKSYALAAKTCSIYQTISQVGELSYTIHYQTT